MSRSVPPPSGLGPSVPAPPSSPAHEAARDARARLDRSVTALRLVPIRFDRAPVSDALRRALAALYVALDTGLDAPGHDESVDESAAALASAIALLEPVRASGDPGGGLRAVLVELEEARVSLTGAADAIAELRLGRRRGLRGARASDAPPAIAKLRASRGLPRVHALTRPPLLGDVTLEPAVPLAERRRKKRGPPLPPEALQALAEAARRGEGAQAMLGEEPPPLPTIAKVCEAQDREELRRVAEDCLSDLGSLGLLRAPGPTERWTDAAAFEQRLLDLLDALASLGAEILPLVPLHLAESPAPDAARAFAATFALGCFAGADAAELAVELFLGAPAEARVGAHDALALASSPAVEAALVERLRLGLPAEARARVLDVLLSRGASLSLDLLGDVLSAERALRPRLVRVVDGAPMPPAQAIALLEDLRDLDDEEGEPAADATFFAATEALLRRGHARARDVLRRAVDRGGARADQAAALLCVAGNAEDAPRLHRRFADAPTPRLARGLGRHGHVDALPPLLDALARAGDDEALASAAADALARISGAPLTETIEQPWGEGAPPPAPGEPPRPARELVVPSRDHAAWSAWLAREGRALERSARHRRGRAMHPLQIVDELLAEATPLAEREEAARELRIFGCSARVPRLDDWVAAQRAALSELRDEIERARVAGGRWGRLRA